MTAVGLISNSIIRLSLLGMFEAIICAQFELTSEIQEGRVQLISRIASWTVLLLAAISTLVWAFFSIKFHCTREPNRVIHSNYQTIYLGMYEEKLNSSHYIILTILVRRIAYASTITYLGGWPCTQVFILIVTSCFYSYFMSHMQPYVA